MPLSQDEQRILAEIERRLVTDDPGLASSLTAFRRPGPAKVLRSPRARIVGSLFTVLLVAMVSMTVYAMIPFRAHLSRPSTTPTAGVPATSAISATSSQPITTQAPSTRQAPAGTSVTATAGSSNATVSTAAGAPQQSTGQSGALLPVNKAP